MSKFKFVSLISGGKDSIFNTVKCAAYGHELVCVANLHPKQEELGEKDSYMYQTVGVEVTPLIAQCLGVPIIRREIVGKPHNQDMYYQKSSDEQAHDEVEDLYELLKEVKEKHPEIQAVASGAIFSNYQRLRVENIC